MEGNENGVGQLTLTRLDVEIIVAVALWNAGGISRVECDEAIGRAFRHWNFRHPKSRKWAGLAARAVCLCGNDLKYGDGPCEQCIEEHAAIYEPNGRRRIFIHE